MKLAPRQILEQLKASLRTSRLAETRWRARSQQGVDYYEGKQLTAEVLEELDRRGQPPVVINRIKPTVRLIVGLLLLNPWDFKGRPVGLNDEGVAEAVTAALKHVSTQSKLPDVMWEAAFQAANAGASWVHVGKGVANLNPKAEPIQAIVPDWREVHPDPYHRQPGLEDCRWVHWSRSTLIQDAVAAMPQHAACLVRCANTQGKDVGLQWAQGDSPDDIAMAGETPYIEPNPGRVDLQERQGISSSMVLGGFDATSATVDLVHTFTRTTSVGYVARFTSGWVETVQLSDRDRVAELLLDPELVALEKAHIPRVWKSTWCDEGLLYHAPYDDLGGELPWVKVVVETDSNGDPVPLMSHLFHSQDEVNKRRSRALVKEMMPTWTLDPSGILQGAPGFPKETADSISWKAGTPGALITLRPGSLVPLETGESSASSWNAYKDAANEIQAGSGANDAVMGIDSSGSQSGRAKELMIETGQQQQKPFERNIKRAFLRLGELIWQLIQRHHRTPWLVRITDELDQPKVLGLNTPERDPKTGQVRILNDVAGMRAEVVMDTQGWTPTLRKASADFIGAMANAEQEPVMKRRLQAAAVKASDFPNRQELLDYLLQGLPGQAAPAAA